MNIIAAIISGLAGTLAMSMLMAVAPALGMPKMDMVGMLGSMFGKANQTLGWVLHLMMGSVFALVYTSLWSIGFGGPSIASALIFGAAHWALVGFAMGMVPVMHVGIRSGEVQAPGLWMTSQGGLMSFMGGLMGHLVFAVVVALVYGLF